MTQSSFRNQIRDQLLDEASKRALIMGVLNITPDSFSDGGEYYGAAAAIDRARNMKSEGVDILDVGGESTRPGAQPVSEADEYRRAMPVIGKLSDDMNLPISIDTYKAAIAREACERGAVVVNDIWGMRYDREMAQVVAQTQSIIVVTYNRGQKSEDINIIDDMREFFDTTFKQAEAVGIPRHHVWLDPGVGFSKTLAQNFEVLRRLDVLQDYRAPILVGLSRKSFIGFTLEKDVEHRLFGTIGSNLAAISNGASIIRVHDVEAHRDALTLFNKIKR